MAERYLRQDALAHRALLGRREGVSTDSGVSLWLEAPRAQIALRGSGSDPGFVDAVRRVTGCALPEALRASHGNGADLLWLGPDEWLVVAEGDDGLHARLDDALADLHALVSDVSSARVVIGLAGPHATDILAKGCSLDLHPRVFAADCVAQSALARAHALLHRLDRDRGFHIYAHRSFADYLFAWLLDAAAEFDPASG